jgi:hypothetical protein
MSATKHDSGESKSDGLVIFSANVSAHSKSSDASELPPVGSLVAKQLEQSPHAATPLLVEDPPEIPMTWIPQAGVAHDVRTRVFVGGLPQEEHERLQALPRRPLVPTDAPNEPWRDDYANYELREDGAILADGVSIELGWVNPSTGTVNWVRL